MPGSGTTENIFRLVCLVMHVEAHGFGSMQFFARARRRVGWDCRGWLTCEPKWQARPSTVAGRCSSPRRIMKRIRRGYQKRIDYSAGPRTSSSGSNRPFARNRSMNACATSRASAGLILNSAKAALNRAKSPAETWSQCRTWRPTSAKSSRREHPKHLGRINGNCDGSKSAVPVRLPGGPKRLPAG